VCAGPLGALYCDYLDWCVSTQQCAGRFSFLFVFFFPPLLLHYFLFFILFFGNVDLTRGEKSGRESRPEKGNLHGARKKKKKKKKEKMGGFSMHYQWRRRADDKLIGKPFRIHNHFYPPPTPAAVSR
jgi:hypothetical protein